MKRKEERSKNAGFEEEKRDVIIWEGEKRGGPRGGVKGMKWGRSNRE